MYQAPPGAKRERQKEDDEPEFKFEWQRKYNAPREDYAKGNADIKDQPFGIPVRNVRCIKCHKWGHINTDKECPLFSQASTSSMPTTSMDPMELMKQMREDGYGLKENVLGHHLNPAAANQQLIPSDESDPEMEFLKSLSASEKKKLLRKLKKLSKKQEKASHCKKKKSKKSGKSKSKSKSSDHKKKKNKKSQESESSDESGSESSSEESGAEEKRKKKKRSKKHSKKKLKERDSSESSDSELEESNQSKSDIKMNQREKDPSGKQHAKLNASSSQKKQNVSSDSETESKRNKYKKSSDSKSKLSKNASKDKNNSSESTSESEENEKRKVNCFKGQKSRDLVKRIASSESDLERNIKTRSDYSVAKKSRSPDKISKGDKKNRSENSHVEKSNKIRTHPKGKSSSESEDEKNSHSESKIKYRSDNLEKKPSTTNSKNNDDSKYNAKLNKQDSKYEKRVKEHRPHDHVDSFKRENLNRNDENSLHEEMNSKRKGDIEDESKQKRKKEDGSQYEEKTKKKSDEEYTKSDLKKTAFSDSIEDPISKRKKDENEISKLKRNKIDFVQGTRLVDEEPSASHSKKRKESNTSDVEGKVQGTADEQRHSECVRKTDESKIGEEHSSQKKGNTEMKQPDSADKHERSSKNEGIKQKCNSPMHPDGFSHVCPQARVETNYVHADEEYQGKEHDDFRHFNRERRSPSVKQKYNS